MTTKTAQKTEGNHAIQNAKAWLDSIYDMVKRFDDAVESDPDKQDEIRDEIMQSPLSVQVRGGWHNPGSLDDSPEEYEILLSTGGPALRITGDLSGYAEPTSAKLEWQDWGTPWTEYRDPKGHTHDAILLSFASHFYFGE